MMLITIEIRGDQAEVRFAFNDVAVRCIRTIPGRLWKPDAKCWSVPANSVNHLATLMERQGFDVEVMGGTGSGDWVEALAERVRCNKKIFLKMSQVLHPDTGGDGRLQQELNDGWQRCCGRRR